MRVIITENYDKLSEKAAQIISSQVTLKPDSILGLATGSTPIGTYKYLIEGYQKNLLDFSSVTTFNLDEYCTLSNSHPQSFSYFMFTNLFDHINIKKGNVHIPSGISEDVNKECTEYDRAIENMGGIDLQLLGVGHNGHIGFNEPDDEFIAPTHVVDLTQKTIDANSRFFDSPDDVPKQAVTMGMKSIMFAKKILFIAIGEEKAEIVSKMINGKITPKVPASILQLHPDITVVLDKDSASKL